MKISCYETQMLATKIWSTRRQLKRIIALKEQLKQVRGENKFQPETLLSFINKMESKRTLNGSQYHRPLFRYEPLELKHGEKITIYALHGYITIIIIVALNDSRIYSVAHEVKKCHFSPLYYAETVVMSAYSSRARRRTVYRLSHFAYL